jgi:hypothetical protein
MMTLQPLPGFESLETLHCVTGSLRHIYVYNEHPLSEDLLLGLGGGVGFIYWHTKGTLPFVGGRANARGEFEPLVGARTGVDIQAFTTSSTRKAEKTLLEILDDGQPVMIHVDMGFLPYFDFGGNDYHFGAHAVVVCGYDAGARAVLIADRDKALHPVSMEVLEQARGSTYKPFPPKHRWYTFDFSAKRWPTPDEVRQAIVEQARGMLSPPIRNFGVPGIRKTVKRASQWPEILTDRDLRFTMFNTYIMIDAEGGTGGGLFRYMFARFLREAADIMQDARLNQSADAFEHIGNRWQEVAEIFKRGWDVDDPADVLKAVGVPMLEIADWEEDAWAHLLTYFTD